MKHITSAGLDDLDPLLDQLRTIEQLHEKKRGVFYKKSKAFLHFHEDPDGYFADVRLIAGGTFDRFRVSTKSEQRRLLAKVRRAINDT